MDIFLAVATISLALVSIGFVVGVVGLIIWMRNN